MSNRPNGYELQAAAGLGALGLLLVGLSLLRNRAPRPNASPIAASATLPALGRATSHSASAGPTAQPTAKGYTPPAIEKSVVRLPTQVIHPPVRFLKAPPGFNVTLAADGLLHPRWLARAPSGDIFVVESRLEIRMKKQPNRVTVLQDRDGDGLFEKRSLWAENLFLPFGITFHNGFLYVANTDSVVRWPYQDGQVRAETPPQTVISGISREGMRQHWTRNIAFSPEGDRLFVTIGSKENADIEPELRATIVTYGVGADGKPGGEPTVYASGVRNPVGMAWNPATRKLWAVVNERDYLGDELVPDYFTEVKEGGFYGWPYYFLGPNRDPRLPERLDLRDRVLTPDVLIPAHSAPLGLVFYQGQQFPESYRKSAFIALHGSQNRSHFTGYKIVRVPFDAAGRPNGPMEDFVTGWLVDPAYSNEVYGRPAGLLEDSDGSLLIADDWGGRIWRIRYVGS